MLKFDYNEAVNIETENPGVLEVPEGKNVEDLPIKHFVDIANRKGLSTVTRALNNLQVWNKNKNKELSKWAGDMIDKVSKRFENQQKNESLQKLNEEFITVDIPQKVYDFHFSGMDKDGYNRDVNKVCVKYYGKGQFVELLLIDDNGIRLGTSRKKFKLVGSDVIITDADKNDIVIGKVLTNESLIREDYNSDLREFADKSAEELKRLARKYGFFLYSDYGVKNDYVDRHWIPTIRFDFAETKSDGDLDKFEKAIRRYVGEFGYLYYIIEPAKVGSYTLCIYGGRNRYDESVDNTVTLDLAEEKELAEFIDWLNEVNIPVAKVNRKFKNITLKNHDDLDEASFYLQDRDYFKKLHDFGWVVSVLA